jgi:hypothetical protein
MPYGDVESWTVLDGGWSAVEPVEAFLSYLGLPLVFRTVVFVFCYAASC